MREREREKESKNHIHEKGPKLSTKTCIGCRLNVENGQISTEQCLLQQQNCITKTYNISDIYDYCDLFKYLFVFLL